jgi:predicted nuclease of predicted toxin-antitoxin system
MSDWRFLLDENVDPKAARLLDCEGVSAEYVPDALREGADGETYILPYAVEHGLAVVTSDVTDFSDLAPADHTGVVLLYDDTMAAHDVASGLLAMVDAYPSRASFDGVEELDPWV